MPEENKIPNSSDNDPPIKPEVDNGGAVYVGGSVDTGGGTFVGRDQVTITEETRDEVSGLPNPNLALRSSTYEDRSAFARTDLK